MRLFKYILLPFFVFFNLTFFGQWNIIKNPDISFSQNGFTPQVSFPLVILPIANNKLIYAGKVQITPSSGGYVVAYKVDDYGNTTQVHYSSTGTGGNPWMEGAASYNDSTVCISEMLSNYQVTYTNNGFKNSYVQGVGGSAIYSVFNTTKHLFILSPMLSYTVDTLMFKRVQTGVAQADTAIYLPKCYIGYSQVVPKPTLTFINDSTGFILARNKFNVSKSMLLKTENYGDNWNEILADSLNQIVSFSYPSKETGYVLKTDGSIYKTTDGGSAWSQITSPSPAISSTVSCIKFSNDSTGYVGGPNGALAKTTNGGMSWANENTGITETIGSIYIFGDSVYFLTSIRTLYKNRPAPTHRVSQNNTNSSFFVYPNPSSNIIHVEFTKVFPEGLTITITDILGKEIYRQGDTSIDLEFESIINIQSFETGIYFLNLNHSGENFRQKIIVRKP